ncbi:MAG: hypothetical protein SGPRY_009163 [Prymnesium sp.]
MLAKSKKPRRKPKASGAKPVKTVVSRAGDDMKAEAVGSRVSGASDPSAPVEDRVAEVLRSAGISDTGGFTSSPQSGDPLSKIPKKGQELLERFFAGGAILFGCVFLASGIAVSVEALCKVLGSPLPEAVDAALIQYVEPALTPSILILFGFSISLGVLKQLQLSSASGGVLYTEEED